MEGGDNKDTCGIGLVSLDCKGCWVMDVMNLPGLDLTWNKAWSWAMTKGVTGNNEGGHLQHWTAPELDICLDLS